MSYHKLTYNERDIINDLFNNKPAKIKSLGYTIIKQNIEEIKHITQDDRIISKFIFKVKITKANQEFAEIGYFTLHNNLDGCYIDCSNSTLEKAFNTYE